MKYAVRNTNIMYNSLGLLKLISIILQIYVYQFISINEFYFYLDHIIFL